MKVTAPKYVIAYGIFLILVGITGFLSNPEKAKTALLSGGTFGAISIVWGLLMAKGISWSKFAAFATTLFLMIVFGWRSWAGWMDVAAGEPKFIAASLITAMLIASIALIPILVTEIGNKAPKTAPPE